VHGFTYTAVDLTQNYLTPPVSSGGTNTTSYAYNGDREVTSMTRPDGQTIALGYDAAGRLTSQTLPTGTFSQGYNSGGRVQSQSSPSGANLTYGYDGSLLTSATATGPVPGSVAWTYDNNFRVTNQSVNGGNSIAFTYDTDSLLTGAGTLTLSRSAQNGLLTGTTLSSVADTYIYNSFAEPTDYQATVSGTPVFRQQYTRDNGGRVTQKTETINGGTDTYSYTYDTVGRLTEVKQNGLTTATYSYDQNGNRLSKTGPTGTQSGTYDDQDRLLSYNGNTYSYTANGELATKTSTSTSTTYTYDVLGNLLSVTQPDGTVIEYVIDGAQRRVGKKVNGALVQGFLYQNQLNPVAELDGSGNLVSRFVYASKGNIPDYLVKNGTTYRIVSDHLGSPRMVVDVTTGAIVQRMDYDEFGQVITDSNPGFQPFGFAGGLYDRDTKLVRFGARDYDAETGRWAAKDPIGFSGGDTNLYGYVLNDPVNEIDPSGLNPILRAIGKEIMKQIGKIFGSEGAGEGNQGASPEQIQMEIDIDGDGVNDFFDPDPHHNPEPFTPAEPKLKDPQNSCP
jgi:RHS repeat-associated protein